ncbi:MAG: hypothetical protein OEO82_13030, partial [Gammaproteobacteria bacterium]|nr:hypothetical protein [Gammaproteobacteria bacterium]
GCCWQFCWRHRRRLQTSVDGVRCADRVFFADIGNAAITRFRADRIKRRSMSCRLRIFVTATPGA